MDTALRQAERAGDQERLNLERRRAGLTPQVLLLNAIKSAKATEGDQRLFETWVIVSTELKSSMKGDIYISLKALAGNEEREAFVKIDHRYPGPMKASELVGAIHGADFDDNEGNQILANAPGRAILVRSGIAKSKNGYEFIHHNFMTLSGRICGVIPRPVMLGGD